jgi:hypothetical protein
MYRVYYSTKTLYHIAWTIRHRLDRRPERRAPPNALTNRQNNDVVKYPLIDKMAVLETSAQPKGLSTLVPICTPRTARGQNVARFSYLIDLQSVFLSSSGQNVARSDTCQKNLGQAWDKVGQTFIINNLDLL